MKKGKIIGMVAVSLGLAYGAAWMANNWLQNRLAVKPTGSDTRAVLVAATQIPFGARVEAAHVKVVDLPNGAVPPGSFSNPEEAMGRIAAQTVYPGEILLQSRIVEHLGGSALAAFIDQGMRALTVRVNDVVGVAGFLLPGNRVDVVAIRRPPGGRSANSETLLQNIKVLAVDQTSSPDKNGPVVVRAVTLEVTPKQAEELAKVTEEGKVRLTLRNPLDSATVARTLDPATVAPPPEPKPVAVKRVGPRVGKVTVIRGTDVSTSKVRL
jgi:pilus assembly protein CpaB